MKPRGRRLLGAGLLRVGMLFAMPACGNDASSPDARRNADSDADYLTDAEEAIRGTDPKNPDTDGDSYLDGDEVLEGTEPLDPESRIYKGGWPYHRFKDDIEDPGFGSAFGVGAAIPRLIAFDQFGQEVDLYDFAMHGRPIAVDLSAIWCGPCKDFAKWLAGEPSSLVVKPELAPLVDRVKAGDVWWITVVFEDGAGNAAGPAQAVDWAKAFPSSEIAVLSDDNRALYDHVFPGSFPSIIALDEDMTVRAYSRFDYSVALAALLK